MVVHGGNYHKWGIPFYFIFLKINLLIQIINIINLNIKLKVLKTLKNKGISRLIVKRISSKII